MDIQYDLFYWIKKKSNFENCDLEYIKYLKKKNLISNFICVIKKKDYWEVVLEDKNKILGHFKNKKDSLNFAQEIAEKNKFFISIKNEKT